jgi:hypothetical protein
MTPPKEKQEREMSAAGQDRLIRRGAAAGPETSAEEFGWRMPGGEDLLKFALSAGLVAGAWWLETRPEAAAQESSEEPCTARAGPGGKK